MILRRERLRTFPSVFRAMTGLTVAVFDASPESCCRPSTPPAAAASTGPAAAAPSAAATTSTSTRPTSSC